MSLNRMSRIAAARTVRPPRSREDTRPPAAELAEAAEQREPRGAAADTAGLMDTIADYIPTEVVALYLAVIAAAGALDKEEAATDTASPAAGAAEAAAVAATLPDSSIFWFFLALTPITVWLLALGKVRAKTGRRPAVKVLRDSWWEMTMATVAFTAWAAVVPGSPFERDWYSGAMAGVGLLVITTFIGVFTPIFAPLPE